MAAVLTLQTAGEALNFNPHLHAAVANGLYLPDGTFKPFDNINVAAITESFQNRVLSALHKKELIDDGTVEQILSQEHSGFSVLVRRSLGEGGWFGEPFQDPDSARFVARYIERGPISLEKLSIEDDIISYATKDGKTHEFDALDFLALLTCHLPKKYESITRYYGYYSCRARGKRAKLLKSNSDSEILHEPSPPPSKSCLSSVALCEGGGSLHETYP